MPNFLAFFLEKIELTKRRNDIWLRVMIIKKVIQFYQDFGEPIADMGFSIFGEYVVW